MAVHRVNDPLRVFLIEDDIDTCDNLREILELDGHRVSSARAARDALANDELEKSSVVLLDRKLPDVSAEEILPQLKQKAPAADIVVMTAHAELDAVIKAFRLGASDYLLKPIEPEALRIQLQQIGKRLRAREQLSKEQEFARSIIETAQAIVLVLDVQGRIVRFNPFLEKLAGYRLEEMVGRDWFETFLPERMRFRTRELFRRVLEGEPVCRNEGPLLTRDGREPIIAWWATPLAGPNKTIEGVLCIGHDVTELQEAQRRVLQAERLAAIGKAMAGLAHESRNALQRSQSGLEMLTRRVADRPDLLELTKRIQNAQDNLHQLYEHVREYAAPIQIDPRRIRLEQIVSEAWSDLAAEREGRVAYLHQPNYEGHLQICADPFALRRVFRNIFENSLAACRDPVEINLHFCETELEHRPALEVVVQDNGPGFSPEAEERVFEEFFTTKTQGTGLGMAICRRLVEAHGGRISLGRGCGAKIVVTLPRPSLAATGETG